MLNHGPQDNCCSISVPSSLTHSARRLAGNVPVYVGGYPGEMAVEACSDNLHDDPYHDWMIDIAKRMTGIAPFHVMDILARARQLESQGKTIVHMEVGEPDFTTLPEIIDAGHKALEEGRVHYTPAVGLTELRQALGQYYQRQYGVDVPLDSIVVTPGASGALQLALGVTINPGDTVLMADPGYPCNRHMLAMYGASALPVPVDESSNFQLNATLVRQYWRPDTRAVMLASPSNPTGTIIDRDDLLEIIEFVQEQNAFALVDEIYHGLVYEGEVTTAANMADNVIVINSFSKYFGMTGWRLGWLIASPQLVEAIDRLAQNIFLAPSTLSQYAAITALSESLQEQLDARRDEFKRRRDYLLPELQDLGFDISGRPQGAFYIYAGCRHLAEDSMALSRELLEQAGVAITPGMDFGHHRSEQYVRFAYTTGMDQLRRGVQAIGEYLNG